MQIKTSNQVDSQVYEDAIAIRRVVFVEEQGIDEQLEIDQVTSATWHYVLYDDSKQAVATARMTPTDQHALHVQRVATLKIARGNGYARALLQQMAQDAGEQDFTELQLGAQVTARGLYERLGYKPQGDIFMEAGLKHQNMTLTL